MAEYGITDQGFVRKRLDEILETKNEGTRGVFGADINLAPQSPDGQINGLAALSDDQLWQIAEYAYNATDPAKATNAALSSLVKINYITRQGDKATRATLTALGTPGVNVPAGQLISAAGGSTTVRTLAAFTFSELGSASVLADCTVVGPVEIGANLLTNIDTPVFGWASVTNPAAALTGRLRETDAELRLRQQRSPGANSQNMVDSLYGLVGDVPGVTFLNVIDNKGDDIDPVTLLAGHSFEVIVVGGAPDELAQAIWRTMPFGIGNAGTSNGNAIDAQGHTQVVNYTIPADVPIYVIAEIHKRTGYPADGDANMKQAIVDYANGDLVQGREFIPGAPVIYSELYTPINTIPFHDIKGLFIGTAPAPVGEDNIPIDLRQASKFTTANIQIIEV